MKEITPEQLRCGIGLCPAVFDLENGKAAIIGSTKTADLPDEVMRKVGENETVIVVPLELLKDLGI